MNIEDLKLIWQDVETAFNDERINSERALQCVLYQSMRLRLSNSIVILVEPHFNNCRPDIVAVNKESKIIECIMELKCAPHWWHSAKSVATDFDKLLGFNDFLGKKVEFDMFGPKRIFDSKKNQWIGGRPQYLYDNDTLLVFADIVNKDSEVALRNTIKHEVSKLPNFVLLIGATDFESKKAYFSVQ